MDTNGTTGTDPLRARAQSGVSWFYWIAALSVVNSIVAASGSTWGFMAGLGITQMIDAIALSIGPGAKVFALALDVLVAALVVGLGLWASRSSAVYLCGMIAYGLDAGLFVLAQDWVGLAFHGLVLFFLWGGWNAQRALDRQGATATATTTNTETQTAKAA